MERPDILDLKKTILEDNDADADKLRAELKERDLFYINVMSSPGAGKTTTILGLLNKLSSTAVLEADIDSDVDARTIMDAGFPSLQLHTGGMCHLDADMSRQALKKLGGSFDIVILENVGNLVCPAEFDTGSHLNLVILSVPEGDDKPLKYPLMFEQCDAVIVNKIDSLPVFDFDMDIFKKNVALRNPDAKIFPISALTGEGVEDVADWIKLKKMEILCR